MQYASVMYNIDKFEDQRLQTFLVHFTSKDTGLKYNDRAPHCNTVGRPLHMHGLGFIYMY